MYLGTVIRLYRFIYVLGTDIRMLAATVKNVLLENITKLKE
jgi:hypothetical protein